ncbi:hypothetical protein Vadar_033728 [Vaccinium darrowii]|uniref:Uncharacterized protein n=1 Tax=Vaccinium darrowii TaxID=229202 RepID=A0ACB7Z0G9_9ERIC|nr:hypothetical protein Vadar_033728 [Vaccinium darrowii]
MKEKRNSKMIRVGENPMSSSTSSGSVGMIRSPQIEIHEMGSALKIVLTTGLDCQHIFNQIIVWFMRRELRLSMLAFLLLVGESGLASCGAARIAEKLKKSFNDDGSF